MDTHGEGENTHGYTRMHTKKIHTAEENTHGQNTHGIHTEILQLCSQTKIHTEIHTVTHGIHTNTTFWFKNPGSDSLAPVFSIFLVESTIVESNGLIRILRPFSFIFSLIFIVSLLFWKKD